MKQIIVDNISTAYYITNDGKCYNSNTGNYLKGQVNHKNGYLSYNLTLLDGRKKRSYAHRLVAIAYIENKYNKKEVNHIDGNKLNNCMDNLEWVSSSENKQHALENELRKFDHVFCFSKDKKLVAEYLNIADAAAAAKISYNLIWQELHKEVKALSGGFYWSFSPVLEKTIEYKNTGKAKVVYQYDLNGKFIISYPSTGVAAKAIGGTPSHIGECCRGKLKRYKNFVWRYAEDIVSPSDESQSVPQAQ